MPRLPRRYQRIAFYMPPSQNDDLKTRLTRTPSRGAFDAPKRRAIWVFTSQLTMLALAAQGRGCASPPPTQWPGASTGEGREPVSNPSSAPPVVTSAPTLAPELLSTFVAATDQPYPSQGHHPPRYVVQVLVNPEAVEAYRNWTSGTALPPGTWLVSRHRHNSDLSASRGAPPLYTMHLEASGWVYGALTDQGTSLPTATEVCQDCHSQAPRAPVFGLPTRS
jgi:hypothetical protein